MREKLSYDKISKLMHVYKLFKITLGDAVCICVYLYCVCIMCVSTCRCIFKPVVSTILCAPFQFHQDLSLQSPCSFNVFSTFIQIINIGSATIIIMTDGKG
jgi:hypothetical protein